MGPAGTRGEWIALTIMVVVLVAALVVVVSGNMLRPPLEPPTQAQIAEVCADTPDC